MLKLSIIVPVYNVEAYLRKCIESLLGQNLDAGEYEVILVDDGSPDGCPAICDEYAVKHDNVSVIHRENGGLSAARNSGIGNAKGKFIQFVDSDDFLEPDVLKFLIDKMETDELDVLRFSYQNINEYLQVYEPNKYIKPYADYRDDICDGLTFLTERLGFGCYACQFIIRRELLNDCLFKERILFEDSEWTPRMLKKALRVTSTDRIVYNYLTRQGSITKADSNEKRHRRLESQYLLIASLQEQMASIDDKRWFEGMIANTALAIICDISKFFYEQKSELIKRLKRSSIFPLSTFHSTGAAIRKICLANLSPMLLCLLMHCRNR